MRAPNRSSSRCTRATRASPSAGARAVCFPRSADEVAAAVRVARRHGRPFVARGSGTGLAGGATPLDDPVVIVTTQMNRVLEVDADARVAWVEPGVLNLDLSRAVRHLGLHYAPDPSSQQACTIGGNVGTNAGGPHCLADGVTSAHVLAVDVVLADGTEARLGGLEPDSPGYDLRGCFVGSEGTMGIATRIAVRLMPDAPRRRHDAVRVRLGRGRGRDRQRRHRGRRAAGRARDDGRPHHPGGRGLRRRRLSARRAGRAARRGRRPRRRGRRHTSTRSPRSRARTAPRCVRVAADDAERALLWKGRKSAFGAIARIAPDYYLHDAVVPRTKLVEVLRRVYEIAAAHDLIVMNVFHAGDGNLHPLLVFDRREHGIWERVYAAGTEILDACLAAGGVLTGEHGVGIEKRDLMPRMFSPDDLDAQARLRDAFDPDGVANPQKVLPRGSRCGEIQRVPTERGYERAVARASARARTGRSAVRRRRRDRGARARGRARVRARRHDDHRRRGHDVRRARRACSPSTARSARSIPRAPRRDDRRHPRVRPLGHRAACGTAPCATTCSRCASRPATAGS